MPQAWIDIEDNDNCGYFPIQTFEVRGQETVSSSVIISQIAEADGPHEVVGWCDGRPCDVRVVTVGDSGQGESVLVHGGNNGIRLRPARSDRDWEIGAEGQFGEPYMLLASDSSIQFNN